MQTHTLTSQTSTSSPIALRAIRDNDPIAVDFTRRKKNATVLELLTLFLREEGSQIDATTTRELSRLARLKALNRQVERTMLEEWRVSRCETLRDQILVSVLAVQFRYILKKKNVGGAILDILHAAHIEVASSLLNMAERDTVHVRARIVFAVVRARTDHILRMSRPVRYGNRFRQRSAMAVMADLSLPDVRDGLVPVSSIRKHGQVPSAEHDLVEAMSFIATSDDRSQCGLMSQSHEDTSLSRFDMKHLLSGIFNCLDRRARRIVVGRWLSGEDMSCEDLGLELGVSRERVGQIQKDSLRMLRYHMEGLLEKSDSEVSGAAVDLRTRNPDIFPCRKNRGRVRGVALSKARSRMVSLLSPKTCAIIEMRFFSKSEILSHIGVALQMRLPVRQVKSLEREGFRVLRRHFPAA